MPESWFEEVRKYFNQQKVFLLDPARSIANLRPTLMADWTRPPAYLVAACGFSLVLGKVNVNLFGERIQRIATLPEAVGGQAASLVAVLLLAVVTFFIFRIAGGRGSMIETIATLMYATSFVLPVLAILFLVITRTASAILGETILFIPPTRILGLGGPETDWHGFVVAAGLATFSVYWNVYFTWLLWAALRELHGIGRIRAGAALLVSVGGVYAISGWISATAGPLIRALLPLGDLFK
jgi:hypothetical protein